VRLPQTESGDRTGGESALGRGNGDEIHGLRLMREGDDPRDIYWRKSTLPDQRVLRERATDTRRDVAFSIDSTHNGTPPDDDWSLRFERRIRDVASRAVAHLKRGDTVSVLASGGERVRANSSVGADPLLRFLALLEPSSETAKTPERAESPKSGGKLQASA
jgi:uncharacterized protein (DUF58 family)